MQILRFNLYHLVEEYVFKIKMGETAAMEMTRKERFIYASVKFLGRIPSKNEIKKMLMED